MAMFRCGGGKVQEVTIYVHGASFHKSSSGANQKGARGKVTLPNLGWTKAVCTSATSSSNLSVVANINGDVSVGSEKDISSFETITLQVTSNATGSGNLYNGDEVNATFILS